ncbi:Hint domain-containing protein [Kribbella sp. NPDC059898]|uniref:Hint domain-containing protein n=1 Tax=Kribbella sp. NPDC059898 TaxID=3346995 RepID=UPI00365F4EBA
MADGSSKAIKDVALGDMVVATDPVTGVTASKKVIDLIRHDGVHTMVAIRLSNGSTIDATDKHPFWVTNRGVWVYAIDLRPGDQLRSTDGDAVTVLGSTISTKDLTAYNLTVATSARTMCSPRMLQFWCTTVERIRESISSMTWPIRGWHMLER